MKLVQETGLEIKQINNWFINQRKRNWNTNPALQHADMGMLTTSQIVFLIVLITSIVTVCSVEHYEFLKRF